MNIAPERAIKTLVRAKRPSPQFLLEALSAAILQLAIISFWITRIQHPFDFFSTLATMSARALALACIVRGVLRYRPQNRFVWWLLGARFLWSLVFAPIRNFLVSDQFWWQVDSAVGTLSYIVVAGYLVRRRAAARDRTLWIDVAVICVGLLFVFLSYLGIPAAENGGLSTGTIFSGIVFPLIDTVLAALILLLAFTSVKERNGALTLLLAAFAIVAAADLSILMAELGMFTMTRTRTFIPISLSFIGLIGIAALLPSMRVIDQAEGNPLRSWGKSRVALIVSAFLLTLYRMMTWTARGPRPSPTFVGTMLSIMFLLIVLRAFLAVRALEASNDRVLHLATHDISTGLLNAVGLEEEYKRLAATADAGLALILVRLRELREIGQLWGHPVRDELVASSATTLEAATQNDGTLARIEVDQFALLTRMPDHNTDSTDRIARRVAHSMRQIPSFRAKGIAPAFDIGIADGGKYLLLESLLKEAESAASVAQTHGKGGIARYDAKIAVSNERRFKLLNLLRGAIERNEFTLLYQPIVDLATHNLACYEALLRWNNPELGSISPSEFIPLAESSEAIEDIGDWVLNTACQVLSTAPNLGSNGYRMSLNVSARSLEKPGLAQRILHTLSHYGVPPAAICLELTERSMMEDPHGELDLLQAVGISLAIDDFGTGYSNLAVLTQFNANTIKLDISLMRAVESDLALRSVLQSMLWPLRDRGMKLVAEGLETREQCTMALEIGCHLGQGWFFGKPQPHLIADVQIQDTRFRTA